MSNARLSAKQAAMLSYLARDPEGADTIMELVRREPRPHGGHSAGYARFHRLLRRGFVTIANGQHITITQAGRDALARSVHG